MNAIGRSTHMSSTRWVSPDDSFLKEPAPTIDQPIIANSLHALRVGKRKSLFVNLIRRHHCVSVVAIGRWLLDRGISDILEAGVTNGDGSL